MQINRYAKRVFSMKMNFHVKSLFINAHAFSTKEMLPQTKFLHITKTRWFPLWQHWSS